MRMNTLACAALLAVAGASHAENVDSTVNLVANAALPGSFSAAFGTTHTVAGAFTDTIDLIGAMAGQVSASLVSIGFLPQTNIDFTSVTLNGTALNLTGGGLGVEIGSLELMPFNGPLKLVVSGIAAPSLSVGSDIAASYAGTVNVTAAVPEPETYALMLAGLCVVGRLARRRFPSA